MYYIITYYINMYVYLWEQFTEEEEEEEEDGAHILHLIHLNFEKELPPIPGSMH